MTGNWQSIVTIMAMTVAAPVQAAPVQDADGRLTALTTAEYAWRQSVLGPNEDNKDAPPGLPDVAPATQAAKLARWTQTLSALDAIRVADLSPAQRVNYAVYRQQIVALLNEQKFRDYEKPLNSDTSFWGNVAEASRGDFVRERDYRNYLLMLRSIPRYFDQNIANMRVGLKRGFTPPQITLRGRDIGVAQVIDAGTGEASPFYAPFKAMPAVIPAATQAALRAEALAVIRDSVVPAHRTLLTFLRDDYIPHARVGLTAYGLPDGRAYYQSKIDEFTTETRTADEIHAIGLAEIARIRARMQAVMTGTGFKGDLPAFLTFLRSDPQFYVKTPQELLDRAAWIAKSFDGKASQWFGRLPRARFAIKPVPADLAPFYTAGRGGPGIYLVNTYALPSRPLYSLPALTLHESAPGHAFQMPLAAENRDLPDFRRGTYLSVYGEGWALYCEALGEEMGMYRTPYELFGMLSYQAWRASRLVVDTGIHAKGWSREQAQRYLHDNTALPDHEIETEVDRYIAWPGQALSYYMGQLAIQRARARAEKALGPKFDIRAFHDAVLALGSVPVGEIERRTDQLIADGGKGPYPDEE
ncbi:MULTISPECIES: DUF885 domain-containing protein [unclassified Sphingomonas]|uniref:DUF885 domain-containing protein n=1 Tax=unclassified Sphingomonas TaxID=196159 RepID=UPI0006F6A224|nr:hypothetical protein ASE65_14640 [Sphingomonas sp. Leaf16]KQN08727.1 hypothetical protein ASE81_14685 [Sphingomonas sp. Leaf29]KQN17306.1 hypothetical protein ASE83_14620 [Sphingomonas sp. Leaf32]